MIANRPQGALLPDMLVAHLPRLHLLYVFVCGCAGQSCRRTGESDVVPGTHKPLVLSRGLTAQHGLERSSQPWHHLLLLFVAVQGSAADAVKG